MLHLSQTQSPVVIANQQVGVHIVVANITLAFAYNTLSLMVSLHPIQQQQMAPNLFL